MESATHHHPPSVERYHLGFKHEPSEVEGSGSVKHTFLPMEAASHKKVELEAVHGKYMHLLIVSEDLSYFSHEHPQFKDHHYVHEHRFPKGGKYILFVDYAPIGSSQQVSRHVIHVEGEVGEPKKLPGQQTQWIGNEYELTLSEDQLPIKSNTLVELSLHLAKAGEPVKNLNNYLGALAHVVIISQNTEEYLHVHPMHTSERGPLIMLHTSFPHSGKYKMFIQFSHEGTLQLAHFVLEIQ